MDAYSLCSIAMQLLAVEGLYLLCSYPVILTLPSHWTQTRADVYLIRTMQHAHRPLCFTLNKCFLRDKLDPQVPRQLSYYHLLDGLAI